MCFVKKQQKNQKAHFYYLITVIRISKARATGHVADRETVKLVMKAMDPEWMSLRATHKLKKRK